MKPSLYDLIVEAIKGYDKDEAMYREELAEQIIKIVRDYHLVEDK